MRNKEAFFHFQSKYLSLYALQERLPNILNQAIIGFFMYTILNIRVFGFAKIPVILWSFIYCVKFCVSDRCLSALQGVCLKCKSIW